VGAETGSTIISIIIIMLLLLLSLVTGFLPGTSLEPAVIPTPQVSSFKFIIIIVIIIITIVEKITAQEFPGTVRSSFRYR
jgi:hypothetical protein